MVLNKKKLTTYVQNISEATDCFKRLEYIKPTLILGKKDSNKSFSILIPTHNRPNYIKSTIKSILAQRSDFQDYEIIILLNNSCSSYDEEIIEFCKNINSDKLLIYKNNKCLNQADNWNQGFKLAESKYVIFLHDDDVLSLDYFNYVLNDISTIDKQNKSFAVLMGRHQSNEVKDDFLKKNQKKQHISKIIKISRIHCLFWGVGPISCPSFGTVFNRDAVIKAGGFNNAFFPSFDYILGYKLLLARNNIFYSDNIYGFKQRGQLTKTNLLKRYVECDYYFREFLYSESCLNKLFGFFFRQVQYRNSIKKLLNEDEKRTILDSIFKVLNFIFGFHFKNIVLRIIIKIKRLFIRRGK